MANCEKCKLKGGILTIVFHICPLEDNPNDYLTPKEAKQWYKQIRRN